MVGTGGPADPRTPTIWFPWVEGLLKLHLVGAMCYDLDGNRTAYADEFDAGNVHGWINDVIEDLGSLAIVHVRVSREAVWTHMLTAFDDAAWLQWGIDLDGFMASCAARHDVLMALAASHGITLDPDNLGPSIRDAIVAVNTGGVAWINAFRTWVLGRIDGTDPHALPQALMLAGSNVAVDFTNFRTMYVRFRDAPETGAFRVLLRLWEAWRLTLILGR